MRVSRARLSQFMSCGSTYEYETKSIRHVIPAAAETIAAGVFVGLTEATGSPGPVRRRGSLILSIYKLRGEA